ncbi:MAG: DUF1015 domain-containing protein [Clostridia bacterium]|nr:DUF1015 domain-containing protein [Clostridia bacterium]
MVDKMPFKVDKELGIQIPEILLPSKNIDMEKWAVVACDQYTSQPEYWTDVAKRVGTSSSTLHMVFPEVYLEDGDEEERISQINSTMRSYLNDNTLSAQKPGFIFIDRKTTHADSRKGLIMAIDLEKYDYNKGSQTLVRATEGTVIERLPPRIKIREKASVESPHVMVLIDDPDKTVIEPIAKKTDSLEKLYDFDLMMSGGHIKGYKIDDEETLTSILNAIRRLADKDVFTSKYGVGSDKGVLLFAVGDGNHSLASAKGHWENVKRTLIDEEILHHPARFALVEVVNVHDDGLSFEPIHRVVFNLDCKHLLDNLVEHFNGLGSKASYKLFSSKACMEAETDELRINKNLHVIPFITSDSFGVISVENPKSNLEVGTLQSYLDKYMANNTEVKIDYIHGEDVVSALGSKEGNIGFYLPPMDKHDLFKTVILDGVLPRKTFSMGEAEEKRFYLECRKICKD